MEPEDWRPSGLASDIKIMWELTGPLPLQNKGFKKAVAKKAGIPLISGYWIPQLSTTLERILAEDRSKLLNETLMRPDAMELEEIRSGKIIVYLPIDFSLR